MSTLQSPSLGLIHPAPHEKIEHECSALRKHNTKFIYDCIDPSQEGLFSNRGLSMVGISIDSTGLIIASYSNLQNSAWQLIQLAIAIAMRHPKRAQLYRICYSWLTEILHLDSQSIISNYSTPSEGNLLMGSSPQGDTWWNAKILSLYMFVSSVLFPQDTILVEGILQS